MENGSKLVKTTLQNKRMTKEIKNAICLIRLTNTCSTEISCFTITVNLIMELKQKVSLIEKSFAYNLIFDGHSNPCNVLEFLNRLSMPYRHRCFQAIHFLYPDLMDRLIQPMNTVSVQPINPVSVPNRYSKLFENCSFSHSSVFEQNKWSRLTKK